MAAEWAFSKWQEIEFKKGNNHIWQCSNCIIDSATFLGETFKHDLKWSLCDNKLWFILHTHFTFLYNYFIL